MKRTHRVILLVSSVISLQTLHLFGSEPLVKKSHVDQERAVISINPCNPCATLTPEDLARIESLEMAETEEYPSRSKGKLGNYQNLELSLQSCQLEAAPRGLEMLTLLKKLNLQYNRFHAMPAEVGTLINLCELDMSYNSLQELPPRCGELLCLEKLNLEGNQIDKASDVLKALKQLQRLYLGFNQLRTIPIGFVTTTLSVLSLPCCGLVEMPKAVLLLSKLTTLDLSRNSIPSNELSPLTVLEDLENLNLSANALDTFPVDLWRLSIQVLLLDDNLLQELPSPRMLVLEEEQADYQRQLDSLSIARNKIVHLPEGLLVSNLHAAGNPLVEIPAHLFNTDRDIEYIHVENNTLQYLPAVLQNAKVEQLTLRNNPLQVTDNGVIPENYSLPLTIIPTLRRLRKLDLSRCGLQQLPDECTHLVWLETLILDDNALTELPFSLANMNSLETISVYQNPFVARTNSKAFCCYHILQGKAFSQKARMLFDRLQAFEQLPISNLLVTEIEPLEQPLLNVREHNTIKLARAISLESPELVGMISFYEQLENGCHSAFKKLWQKRAAQLSFLREIIEKKGSDDEPDDYEEMGDFDGYNESGDSSNNSELDSDEQEMKFHEENEREMLIVENVPEEYAQANQANWSHNARDTYEAITQISDLMRLIASCHEHLRFIRALALTADSRGLSFGYVANTDNFLWPFNDEEQLVTIPRDVKNSIWKILLSEKKHFDCEENCFKWPL